MTNQKAHWFMRRYRKCPACGRCVGRVLAERHALSMAGLICFNLFAHGAKMSRVPVLAPEQMNGSAEGLKTSCARGSAGFTVLTIPCCISRAWLSPHKSWANSFAITRL
jgi:hypothetical protein